ncbi:BlaI/MecI/CopY family transcriptional regulator [Thermocatellispora tengchongensis]|uniref:BlaI/MecI/CopY family transcriptional regulator n=1 Tax=Thermocatellispora tengchongensis TaxID=1073253 RepID=UPI0033821A29
MKPEASGPARRIGTHLPGRPSEERSEVDAMPRRKLGQLEAEVLAVLAGADDFLSPGDIAERLEGGTAYTTVNTILFRLLEKNLVERARKGRAYVYRLTADESGLAAERMFGHLRLAHDPSGVLTHFVHGLSPEEEAALRALLDEHRSDA